MTKQTTVGGWIDSRTPDQDAAIAKIRMESKQQGINDVGGYCMWLEDELLKARVSATAEFKAAKAG